jgi:enoyl-CoA hydratase/carnithine racemase
MTFATIRYEVEDRIATITLARPDKLNAIDSRMIADLLAALDRIDTDDAVRAVIVTGEGRAFCSGADLSRGEDAFVPTSQQGRDVPEGESAYDQEWAREPGGRVALRIFALTKPIIAAINGGCAGAGATLPLPMDVRLASDTAKFGFVFARRGMVPEVCSSWFLPRLVGISTALEWCCSGRMVGAEEALAAGLVRAVLPPDQLMGEARRLAREMTEQSAPVSIALTRQMLWRGLGMAHPMEAHRVESRGIYALARHPDAAEGVRAFLEKRVPEFPGKISSDMPDYYPWWTEPDYR